MEGLPLSKQLVQRTESMKTVLFQTASICLGILSSSFSLTAQQQFDKEAAIVWLNTKMTDAAKYSTVDNGSYTAAFPEFVDCSLKKKLEERKADLLNPLLGDTSPDVVEYYTLFTVELSMLTPESASIHKYDDKFWVDVATTNSTESVVKTIGYTDSGVSKTFFESTIRIGPFKQNSNLETRVLGVIKKLIDSCGGKKEAF